jgi:hypothetical protein
MGGETHGLPAGAREALFWCLWAVAQAAAAVSVSRLVVFGTFRAGPDRVLSRIRPWARRGDWCRVEAACRVRHGPFARLALLFTLVRGQPEACRERVLTSGIASLLLDLDTRAKGLLLAGACALASGCVGGAVAYLSNSAFPGGQKGTPAAEEARCVAVRQVAWPPVVGVSAFLSCLGAYGLARARLATLAFDLELVQALLEGWSRSGAARALPWEPGGFPQRCPRPPPFSDN